MNTYSLEDILDDESVKNSREYLSLIKEQGLFTLATLKKGNIYRIVGHFCEKSVINLRERLSIEENEPKREVFAILDTFEKLPSFKPNANGELKREALLSKKMTTNRFPMLVVNTPTVLKTATGGDFYIVSVKLFSFEESKTINAAWHLKDDSVILFKEVV